MENIYCIKDSNGSFEGRIYISTFSEEKGNPDWKWDYVTDKYPQSGNLTRENVLFKIEKLRELNLLAEFGNGLDWEIVEFTDQEWTDLIGIQLKKNDESGRDWTLNRSYNTSVESKDVKRGCIGKTRKLVKDIFKKYKYMPSELMA